MSILIIVESPGKIKKIEHYLGNAYKVKASMGHIMDLPSDGMHIDFEHDFKPDYAVLPAKKKTVKDLQTVASKASKVLLASDEDREGEFISWSVAQLLKIKKPLRITFTSITKTDLIKAVEHPRDIDYNMVHAQQARRILDRIVGYTLSPLLQKKVFQGKGVSAGRVQSVVVRLIIDREEEIKKFLDAGADSFYKCIGTFKFGKGENKVTMTATLHDLEKKSKNKTFEGGVAKLSKNDDSDKPKEVLHFLKKCSGSEFAVANVFDKEVTKSPSAPYITSTLQQEAGRKFGFSAKKTMQVAQKLYENGHITYMRTDSTNLSEDAHKAIKKFVEKKYGEEYYRHKEYKSKSKNAQEAHEAIRPTDIPTVEIEGTADEKKLYMLVWKRAVASQMSPAKLLKTFMQITISKDDTHFFEASVEKIVFPGFLKVYNIADIEKDEEEENGETVLEEGIEIPKVGTQLRMHDVVAKQDYNHPPPRYTEASLIKQMEKLDIGRPATYASMVNTVQDREYVEKKNSPGVEKKQHIFTLNKEKEITPEEKKINLGKDTNKLVPTEKGKIVNAYLLEKFPEIMDYGFTAEMENKLDAIARGEKTWTHVLKKFYTKFQPAVEKALKETGRYTDKFNRKLGMDPETGKPILAVQTKIGPAVMLDLGTDDKGKHKGKYANLDPPLTIETVTLKQAIKLLKEKAQYPKILGQYKEKDVTLNKGPTGFYVRIGDVTMSVPNENIDLAEAIKLLEEKAKKLIKRIETDKYIYTIQIGQYGPYISKMIKPKGKTKRKTKPIFASIPKEFQEKNLKDLTEEQCEAIIKDYLENRKSRFHKFKKKDGEGKTTSRSTKKSFTHSSLKRKKK